MSSKQPDVKFSPFEALLIGEKNKVIRRHPVKNTIFVGKREQKNSIFNLRVLFGLDKSPPRSKRTDDIFKMPQRVHEYLNNKKHNFDINKITVNKERKDIDCGEFKEPNVLVKSYDSVKPKSKKSNSKSNKVKFKEKYNRDGYGIVENKVQHALKINASVKKSYINIGNGGMSNVVSKESGEYKSITNRYGLRGKDCKFIGQTEYECLDSKDVNSKNNQENFVCKFVMDDNKNIFNNDDQIENDNLNNLQMPNSKENITDMEQFDISDPDILFQNEYYCHEDFEFPTCPKTEMSDFDDDENLIDIIYEDFPKSFKFESEDSSNDFIDALISANIIEPLEDMEKNIAKENLERNENLKVSYSTQSSSMEQSKPIGISTCYHVRALEKEYISTADDFVAIQNHLITNDNFERLFLNKPDSQDKNDLIMTNLMKPLIHNSWVRSLKNF